MKIFANEYQKFCGKLWNIPSWPNIYKDKFFLWSYKILIERHKSIIMVITSKWEILVFFFLTLLLLIFLWWIWIDYIINMLSTIKSIVFPRISVSSQWCKLVGMKVGPCTIEWLHGLFNCCLNYQLSCFVNFCPMLNDT